ncbi:collagen-like protein [Streptomyces sp. NPDC018031]|uniref:collagen-like protein n=1 Tax=Streptomyces sp. NPDC018031 TaxID=3365033 RepID=UPI0037923C35
MTRAQRALARRWRPLVTLCWLVALSGATILIWARISGEAERADQLAAEADRRGAAVSTLAGDVRLLRAQLAADGQTPAAPDPADAVEDLPARAEVPVPVPGPRGPAGTPGQDGADGRDGETGAPGETGADGADGMDGEQGVQGPAGPPGDTGPQGPAGPPGPAGADGQDGRDGTDGRDGQVCPDGYSLQPPADDPDALVCRRDGAPAPDPTPSTPTGQPALLDRRRS